MRVLLREEQGPAEVLPGVTVNGLDIGTWIHRQTDPDVWTTLLPEQSERLTALGLTPRSAPAAPAGKGAGAFERGIAALTQYAQREGHLRIPRQHTELVVIDGQEHAIKAGIFLTNHKSRRATLNTEKLAVFAALGADWATV